MGGFFAAKPRFEKKPRMPKSFGVKKAFER
jgi:hypothetical protein